MLAWVPWVPNVPPLTAGGETGAALWSRSEDAGAVPGDVSNLDLESVEDAQIRYCRDKSKYGIVKPLKRNE